MPSKTVIRPIVSLILEKILSVTSAISCFQSPFFFKLVPMYSNLVQLFLSYFSTFYYLILLSKFLWLLSRKLNLGLLVKPEHLFLQHWLLLVGLTCRFCFTDGRKIFRVRTGHGKPGKSWNFMVSFSRSGKSWNLSVGHKKSWKMTLIVQNKQSRQFFLSN